MQLQYDHYYGYAELTAALETLTAGHPGLAKLASIGTTSHGRQIWSLTLTNQETGPDSGKPAIYIDGNHHAGELVGSMVSLYLVDYLLSNYGKCSKVTNLLDTVAFYVVPRVSPDGAEHYLETPEALRSIPRYYPFPEWEEMDGLYPADIDGDGEILLMRMRDQAGEWKISKLDPRAMAVRRPDEKCGEFYRLLPEGLMHNYDGVQIKGRPAKYGLDLNRNYPNDWAVEGQQAGAGPHPLSEPESRAVAEFLTRHANISVAISHHTTGGAILVIPGSRDPRTLPAKDMEALKLIADIGEQVTGHPNVSLYNGFHVEKGKFNRGAFDEWLYLHRGIIGFTTELWNLAVRSGVKVWPAGPKTHAEQEQDFVRMLKFQDQELMGEAFESWRPYDHPQLGPVEIGGWKTKFNVTNAPPRFLAAECHKLAQWCVCAAGTLPALEIRSVRVAQTAEGVYAVSCGVYSTGYLPTTGSDYATEIKMHLPFEVRIEGEGLAVVGGEAKRTLSHLPGRCGAGGLMTGYAQATPRPSREVKVSWVVKAVAGTKVKITAATPRAGTATQAFEIG